MTNRIVGSGASGVGRAAERGASLRPRRAAGAEEARAARPEDADVVGRERETPRSGTVAGMHDDTGDVRLRAIAELALAVETGGDVKQAVQAAYLAGVEPYEIAELSGLPMRRWADGGVGSL